MVSDNNERLGTRVDLPAAVSGECFDLHAPTVGRLAFYTAGPDAASGDTPPLLLIHSVNAAGSAYEVKPLYEHFRRNRRVYALELPGFGFSAREDRDYTPRLMCDAVLAMVDEIARRHAGARIDALALSLSCEFLARAAVENAPAFRTVALVSPTGFDRRGQRDGPPESTRAMPALHSFLSFRPWSRGLYDLLTSRRSIRYFLQKTWGSKSIDEGMLAYDWKTAHQPGAQYAPYCFVSGYLFSKDINRIYQSLRHRVWMAHGVRGDFTDYSHKDSVQGKPNWTIDVFQTGALPHFEVPDLFVQTYDRFLEVPDA